ncbi:hypothetical protein M3Y95_00093800 [Aphelenchoides besseyi]|nr:hypothetical protein M3Y95_00093800 [Aphelenchoides besseyi]
MHHSFVDLIWEDWRQMRQPRWVREMAFTPDLPQCANPMHFSYAPMRPFFNLANRDGLSNAYTDQLYRYAPRATCTLQSPTCNSKYLFCDTRIFPHCVAKVKMNGLCLGFEGFDACYNGQCMFGRCVPGPTPAPFRASRPRVTTPMPPRQQPTGQIATRPFVDCFNRHPCCESWAQQGECRSNAEYMGSYCRASCQRCTPTYNTTNGNIRIIIELILGSECPDRHVSCQQWSATNQCNGNSRLFMEANCRSSCRLCGEQKAATCQRPTRQNNRSSTAKPEKPVNPIRRAFRRLRAFWA